MAIFTFFQNSELGKASTDDKCHFQSLGLDLVNINVYAKVYQNIPNGLRVHHKPSGNKIFTNFPVTKSNVYDYRAQSESQPSVSADFIRVVQYVYLAKIISIHFSYENSRECILVYP